MFIELPHSLARSADFQLELEADYDEPQTLTAAGAKRSRGVGAGSRILLSTGRGARHCALRASVDGALSVELTITQD